VPSRRALLGLVVTGLALAAALGDLLRLPTPYVPPSLRLLPAILAGALLGPRWGAGSQLLFAAAAAAVALARAGQAGLLPGPWPPLAAALPADLGYPLALPACAAVVGWLAGPDRKPARGRLLAAGAAGLLLVDLTGVALLAWLLPPRLPGPIGAGGLLRVGVLFPLPWDLAQVVLAALLLPRLRRRAPWLAFPEKSR
jgi:biotin transport system substrate-specific component